jgi:uncharacterized protein (TIGR02246 family)
MNKKNIFQIATGFITFSILSIACSPAPEQAAAPEAIATSVSAEPDMAAIKAEIQAIETTFAAADNAGDIPAILALYADDAVSMGSGTPVAVGKAAIQKELEAGMASRPAGVTVAYEVVDIFGDENEVTEVGKITRKDASGKVISTGKYMAIWEKRDGKYICVRDISNNDSKED